METPQVLTVVGPNIPQINQDGAILKNWKKSLNIFVTDFDEIWHADASRPSAP